VFQIRIPVINVSLMTRNILKVLHKYITTLKYPSIVYLWVYLLVLLLVRDQDPYIFKIMNIFHILSFR